MIFLYKYTRLCSSYGKSWDRRNIWASNTGECRFTGLLLLLKVVASNLTADVILLIIDLESVSYVEIMKRLGAQSPELWLTVDYMKLCVDRELKCGLNLVLPSWQYLKSESSLFQDVYGVEQQSTAVLHSRQCHCSTGRTAIYRCTAHHIIQQMVPL